MIYIMVPPPPPGLMVYEKRLLAPDRKSAVCIARPFLIPVTQLLIIIPSSQPESKHTWSSKRTGSKLVVSGQIDGYTVG